MEYTLTIVARDPQYIHDNRWTDAVPPNGENDVAIAEVMERLRKRKNTNVHAVHRMSTVADIIINCVHFRATYGQMPDVLQLVGHGMPGALGIGQSWLPANSPIVANGLVYTLNSDPNLYLQIKYDVAPKTTLRVLGCDAGKIVATNGAIVDGPTFLFALTRLLGVAVEGPICMIGADDFDQDLGTFNKPEWLMTAHKLEVKEPPTQEASAARKAWLL